MADDVEQLLGRGSSEGVWVVLTRSSGCCWLGLLRPVPPVIAFGVLSAARAANQMSLTVVFRSRWHKSGNLTSLWSGQATLAASHMEHLCLLRVCTAVITKSHNCLLLPRLPCCLSKDGVSIMQCPVT